MLFTYGLPGRRPLFIENKIILIHQKLKTRISTFCSSEIQSLPHTYIGVIYIVSTYVPMYLCAQERRRVRP